MDQNPRDKLYDLEERTHGFASRCRVLIKRLPRSISNLEDARQLARASGSVGANYIEANEALGKKDFKMHLRIARKESKESRFFLRLLDLGVGQELDGERAALVQEATELIKIFSAMLRPRE